VEAQSGALYLKNHMAIAMWMLFWMENLLGSPVLATRFQHFGDQIKILGMRLSKLELGTVYSP
jgi:lipid-A-disaccharide synthase-like uncharacterized protein